MQKPILKVGDPAPIFKAQDDRGDVFDLSMQRGKWTVLYFYPKAGTPGCTRQACAFRDGVAAIRDLGGEVFGVSADRVDALARFRDHHGLNFSLLSDQGLDIIRLYGCKFPLLSISNRWTFIIGPDLRIRSIDRSVNPVEDAQKVAAKLSELVAVV